jgi:hypothetical protein
MVGTNPLPNIPMPYLASLNILDLTKLTNDPILHDPTWPNMPAKFPSDISKFEGKLGEDPANHVMTFHLWFSLNNISSSPTQPSHTPMSATILGSDLLGSTFLGSNTQGHPSFSFPSQGGRIKLLIKGEVQTHQIPLKGWVHYLHTQWLELILHQISLFHTWHPSTFLI